jgi:dienelactone hydrolase
MLGPLEPLFLSCAETDHTFPTEARNKAIDLLIKDKKPYGLQLFSGVAHGFALRCNLEVPYERECLYSCLLCPANRNRILQRAELEGYC